LGSRRKARGDNLASYKEEMSHVEAEI